MSRVRDSQDSLKIENVEVAYVVLTGAALPSNNEAEQIVLEHPARFLEALRAGRVASRNSFKALLETITTRPTKVATISVSRPNGCLCCEPCLVRYA